MTRDIPDGASIDAAEIARFSALAERWWDPAGPFKALHNFNPVRLDYVRDHVAARFKRDPREPRSIDGLRLLDVGCGGGLLCEPMARLGAEMVGIDPSQENIGTARVHAAQSGLAIDYRATTAEALAAEGERFDAVLAMEVIEHVADVPGFMAACSTMVKPGGLIFVATINRTAKAFALAIVGAEYVLGWLPRGTHRWEKFLRPEEIGREFTANGLQEIDGTGVVYSPFADDWRRSRDMEVNYMLVAGRSPA